MRLGHEEEKYGYEKKKKVFKQPESCLKTLKS